MQYFPCFFDVKDQPCLVVGGGVVAERKARLLLRAKAKLTVVAPSIQKTLEKLLLEYQTDGLICREFDEQDVDGMLLVVAATDDNLVNAKVSQLCKSRNIPVNVVDQPTLSSFIVPSIVDRAPLIIGVSSAGNSPVLARYVRAKLESILPSFTGLLTQAAGNLREQVKSKISVESVRRVFWENTIREAMEKSASSMLSVEAIEEYFREKLHLHEQESESKTRGHVYLIGAGPGGPDYLTIKGYRLLQQADVVLYDQLVSEQTVELARRDAIKVKVGKYAEPGAAIQKNIGQLLVSYARQDNIVVRLKGGDPSIFGRLDDEIKTLKQEQIDFSIVAGVTAASAVASVLSCSLTHKVHGERCLFMSAHDLSNRQIDWAALTKSNQTLVFYMARRSFTKIATQLMAFGSNYQTPAVLVFGALCADELCLRFTLESLARFELTHDLPSGPVLLLIGYTLSY